MEQSPQDNNEEPTKRKQTDKDEPIDNQGRTKHSVGEKTGPESFSVGIGSSVFVPVAAYALMFLSERINSSVTTTFLIVSIIIYTIVIPLVLWKMWHFRLGMLLLGMLAAPIALVVLAFGGCLALLGGAYPFT
jgi:hypothetical protein